MRLYNFVCVLLISSIRTELIHPLNPMLTLDLATQDVDIREKEFIGRTRYEVSTLWPAKTCCRVGRAINHV